MYDIDVLIELILEHYFIYGMKIHNVVDHMNKMHCYPLNDIQNAFNKKCLGSNKTLYQILIDNEDKQICKDMGVINLK
jgi:hypothetical protein